MQSPHVTGLRLALPHIPHPDSKATELMYDNALNCLLAVMFEVILAIKFTVYCVDTFRGFGVWNSWYGIVMEVREGALSTVTDPSLDSKSLEFIVPGFIFAIAVSASCLLSMVTMLKFASMTFPPEKL